MKRSFLSISMLIMTILMLYALASIATAYSKEAAICWHITEKVTVDANLKEWNTSTPLKMNRQEQLIRDANQWSGEEDLSAEVYLMWDETSLYLAAKVLDDTPFMYREGFPPDLADALVMHFGTNPGSNPDRATYESTDFRLTLIIDDYYFNTGLDRSMVSDKKGMDTKGDAGDEQVLTGYEYDVAEIKGGYVFEAKIPLANFSNDQIPVMQPGEGIEIGFDISMFDLDFPCPGIATARMAWTGGEDIDVNPSKWGILVFKGLTGGTNK